MLSLPGKLSRYATVATLLLKYRGALGDPQEDDAEQLASELEAMLAVQIVTDDRSRSHRRTSHRRPNALTVSRGPDAAV